MIWERPDLTLLQANSEDGAVAQAFEGHPIGSIQQSASLVLGKQAPPAHRPCSPATPTAFAPMNSALFLHGFRL